MIRAEFSRAPEQPRYRILLTRHAERLPSGVLSPDGIEAAKEKGRQLSKAEIVKAYASDEKSKRTVVTGDSMSRESGTMQRFEDHEGALHERPYVTREVADITYSIFRPDMRQYTKVSSRMNDSATVRELDSLSDRDEFEWVKSIPRTADGRFAVKWGELSSTQQIQVAPIRARNQKVGFDWLLGHKDAVHRAAFCSAHELVQRISVSQRHHRFRESLQKEQHGDIIQNIVTHRFFIESLLLEAGLMIGDDGTTQRFQDIEQFGGWLDPLESIEIDLDDPAHIPSELPVSFERKDRPERGRVFVDLGVLHTLDQEYGAWKKSRKDGEDTKESM